MTGILIMREKGREGGGSEREKKEKKKRRRKRKNKKEERKEEKEEGKRRTKAQGEINNYKPRRNLACQHLNQAPSL
jgi:hypothetical protein